MYGQYTYFEYCLISIAHAFSIKSNIIWAIYNHSTHLTAPLEASQKVS